MTSEYSIAVHALVFLSHKACIVSSEALAENICTNPARVRKVLASLKRAGLVSTKEGADGGYAFVQDAGEVSLRQVAEAVGVCFVSASWRSGGMDLPCLVASGMADLLDQLYGDLDSLCKQHLQAVTIRDIEAAIFQDQPLPSLGKEPCVSKQKG